MPTETHVQALKARAHGIPFERVLLQTESEVELEVSIPAASDYFDGHFPQFKLLPAVAQIDLVTTYARDYFGVKKAVSGIKRCKFIAPLLPDATVRFQLKCSADAESSAHTIAFKIIDSANCAPYASGTLKV